MTYSLKGDSQLHFVLIAGQPLNEPVVQHGMPTLPGITFCWH